MRVLVLGRGGREHALAWSLHRGGAEVFALPGSDGMQDVAEPVAGDAADPGQVIEAVRRLGIDLVVPGPEELLVLGVAETLRAENIAVFGPDRRGAQIEASKAYAKTLLRAAGIETAAASLCRDFGEVEQTLAMHPERTVLKADGLAAGKGVIVAEDAAGARRAARRLLQQHGTVLLEERLRGPEVSLIALCAGRDYALLPTARDHKRLLTGDAGPNTGGMGAICPVPITPDAEVCAERTIAPLLHLLAERGTPFQGALYAGLILTERGPMVLEYNVRFGDPEAQVILPALEESILPWLEGAAHGALPNRQLVASSAAVGVVMAAEGYPEAPNTGAAIDGLANAAKHALVFHSGTKRRENGFETAGGRVLCLVGRGDDILSARTAAYDAVACVQFPGALWRDDIGIDAAR
ncbi:MAG: phosphoribosylamine--glycine ligase [Thermaerobacter sp.]|nr:phosphoribosylamine--glycine ligase [Thermaerobacter sp.]